MKEIRKAIGEQNMLEKDTWKKVKSELIHREHTGFSESFLSVYKVQRTRIRCLVGPTQNEINTKYQARHKMLEMQYSYCTHSLINKYLLLINDSTIICAKNLRFKFCFRFHFCSEESLFLMTSLSIERNTCRKRHLHAKCATGKQR